MNSGIIVVKQSYCENDPLQFYIIYTNTKQQAH